MSTAALLPVLLMTIVGGPTILFRCQWTGLVSPDGCCPALEPRAGESNESPPLDAKMASAACCTRESVAIRQVPSEPAPSAPHDLGVPMAAVASVPAGSSSVSIGDRPPYAADSDSPPQTPLLLAKRSLLI